MCFTISNTNQDKKKLEKLVQATVPNSLMDLPVQYVASGFAHPWWPVVTTAAPHTVQLFRWGLIPQWTPHIELARKFENQNLNARSETVFEKKSFSRSIRRQRCVIPVTGFFEWREVNKKKYPYHIHLAIQDLFCLGGIYDSWEDPSTGEVLYTFSILTTPANRLMAKIHNRKLRMPLILPNDLIKEWLNPNLEDASIQAIMQPLDEQLMQAYTISRRISSRTNNPNVPESLMPFEYPELALLDA